MEMKEKAIGTEKYFSTVRKKKVAGEEPGTCRSNRILRLVVGR